MDYDGIGDKKSEKKSLPGQIDIQVLKTPVRSKKLIAVGLLVFMIGAALVIFGHVTNPDDRVRSFFVRDGKTYTSSNSAVELSQDSPLFRMLSSDAPELVSSLETIKNQKKQAKIFWLAGYSTALLGSVLFVIGFSKKRFNT
jgi:hypothetical protein